MLRRDGEVTMEFIQSLAFVQNADRVFNRVPTPVTDKGEIGEFFVHVASMPDVLRTNIYNTQYRIIWSSNAQMIGRVFPKNPEL
jgi:hypothetical protein